MGFEGCENSRGVGLKLCIILMTCINTRTLMAKVLKGYNAAPLCYC